VRVWWAERRPPAAAATARVLWTHARRQQRQRDISRGRPISDATTAEAGRGGDWATTNSTPADARHPPGDLWASHSTGTTRRGDNDAHHCDHHPGLGLVYAR
jgi:hypothetical protein